VVPTNNRRILRGKTKLWPRGGYECNLKTESAIRRQKLLGRPAHHNEHGPWRIQAFLSHYLLPVLLLHIPTLLQKVSKHGWWPFLRSLDYWEGHARRTVADDHVCEYPNQLLAGALDTFFDWLISLPLAVPARFRWSDTHQIDHDGHDTIILLVLETVINASRVREKKLEAGNN
jgi:hypothetical protein